MREKEKTMISRWLPTVSLVVVLVGFASAAAKDVAPPANAAANARWDAAKGELTVEYHGTTILTASVTAKDAGGKSVAVDFDSKANATDEKVEQTFTLTPAEPKEGVTLALIGTVAGSEEAFPAETDSEAQKRFPYVRNSVGLSRNLRNNAVYDRRWDWVLIGPADGATRITPKTNEENKRTFGIESKGGSFEFVFRPRFYQKHHGYEYYEPWTYKVWEGSLTGYCTWWAYRYSFTQETLDAMLELFVEKHLPDFGYDYMQFDDTYQQGNGSCPENCLFSRIRG